ncbi:MAG TPA: hypothetical protein PKG48_06510 [Bacteroidales bacterium]|nr:hypothetical protein [Bacteroidales bacterium]HPS63647.1 hypothetical protein [Bacteroidales bacterium]
MKKVLAFCLVAIFATAVWGQAKQVPPTKPPQSEKKVEIKPTEVPICIQSWMKINLEGYTINKAYKLDSKNEISYIVRAVKDKEIQWLAFDRECKMVKKINPADAERAPQVPDANVKAKQTDPPKPVPPVKEKKEAKPAEKGIKK